MKTIIHVIMMTACFLATFSCADKLKETPDDKFVGQWTMQGRSMFEGIVIDITKQDGKLSGRIIKLNDNKLIKMFADTNDVWVSSIERLSNFEFKLTEKKIAKDLFSVYGLPTSQTFNVEFVNDSTIGLATESADPRKSTIVYKRLK